MPVKPVIDAMNQAVADQIFPGAVLLCAKKEHILFHEAFGSADIYAQRKVVKDSIFDLASLTKPLATTLAVAKLMEKHPRLLNRRLGTIIDPFRGTNKENITVEMLLRHTSGYPAHREYFKEIAGFNGNVKDKQLEFLVRQRLEYRPGSRQVYSDLGFMVLKTIVEVISGLSLDLYVGKEIYTPLGITSLFFIPKCCVEEVRKQYTAKLVSTQNCPWRKRLMTGEVDDENAWAVGGVDGHAGLFGDAISVHMLCSQILSALTSDEPNSSIFSADVLRQFVVKKYGFEKVAGFDTPSKTNSSAGGCFSRSAIGHLGFTGTSFWMDPEDGFIVILLTNRIHPERKNEQIKKFRPLLHDLVSAQLR